MLSRAQQCIHLDLRAPGPPSAIAVHLTNPQRISDHAIMDMLTCRLHISGATCLHTCTHTNIVAPHIIGSMAAVNADENTVVNLATISHPACRQPAMCREQDCQGHDPAALTDAALVGCPIADILTCFKACLWAWRLQEDAKACPSGICVANRSSVTAVCNKWQSSAS